MRRVLFRLPAFVLAASLIGCAAAAPPTISAYNRGVDAFRAEDYAAARVFWTQAVAEGEVSASNNLGYLLFYGKGGPVDRPGGLAAWRRAATLGHSEAQWHLGVAYEKGQGVPVDLGEAYAWYRCAIVSAEAGGAGDSPDAEDEIASDARRSLADLLDRLPPERFGAAEALAKQYVERYATRRGGG